MNPQDIRNITSSISHDAAERAAKTWFFDEQQVCARALAMRWELINGRSVTNGERQRVTLETIFQRSDFARLLARQETGGDTHYEIQDLLMIWCMRAAERVLREEMLDRAEVDMIQEQARGLSVVAA